MCSRRPGKSINATAVADEWITSVDEAELKLRQGQTAGQQLAEQLHKGFIPTLLDGTFWGACNAL